MVLMRTPPTEDELETFHEVLEWFIEHTKRNEPHAVVTIASAEELSSSVPTDPDDFE